MEPAALDAVSELYRRTAAAMDGLAALIAACAPAAEIAFAAAELADFRVAWEHAASLITAVRRESLREGRQQRDAELAARAAASRAAPRLRAVSGG